MENYNNERKEDTLEMFELQNVQIREEKKRRRDNIINNQSKFLINLGFSIFIGILASIFLVNPWGIGISILVGLAIIAFFCINGVRNKSYFGFLLVISSFLLSVTFGIFNSDLKGLNIIVIWFTLMAGFMALTYENFENIPKVFLIKVLKRIFTSDFIGVSTIPSFIKNVLKKNKIKINKPNNSNLKNIFKGLLISIPVLAILVIMLSNSDEVFKYYLSQINFSFSLYDFSFPVTHIISIIIFLFVFSYLFAAYNSFSINLEVDTKESSMWNVSIFTVSTVLIMIIILYLCFTFIQVSHLYGSRTLPNGITHAQYARSGFFDLIYVVIINMILVATLKNKIADNSKNTEILLNVFYSIITILTLNMSVAAFYKMNMYIEAYGYTELRVLVSAFIIFLIITMLYMLMFIWKNTNIFKITMITALVIYIALNFMNIDNFIASKNIANKTIDGTDQSYISSLSVDASNTILKAYEDKRISEKTFKNWLEWNSYDLSYSLDKFYSYNYNSNKFNKINNKYKQLYFVE